MRFAAFAAATSLAATTALAQVSVDYGLDWVTVGAPGNRATLPSEAPSFPDPMGAVDYEFRITRTPVTASQWLEFVEAYAPYLDATTQVGSTFTGLFIHRRSGGPAPRYEISPGKEQFPVDPAWHYAATYCNWLHNGKAREQWAFETGAYDISTFYVRPDRTRADQRERSPGAQFFLPDLDEWTKAVYYDPDRYGPGDEGYWLYPNASQEPLVSGGPGAPAAQTSAGTGELVAVGQYPEVTAPWGLLDASGGTYEWIEDVYREDGKYRRLVSSSIGGDPWHEDRIDMRLYKFAPHEPGIGFRIAAAIPAPGCGALVIGLAFLVISRSR
jgi:formylglycine-generating enzyme required for sulfatase activity